MIKNKTVLEVKVSERVFELVLDNDSPLGEVFDAITQMQRFVVDRINAQVPQEVKDAPKEEVKPDGSISNSPV
jgi:hypothetical protein